MTALAGYWSFAGAPAAALCAGMLSAQAIYGPDGDALWDGGPVALGRGLFRSLPEDAHDTGPVAGGGGRLMLAADVRIDNRADLLRASGSDGTAKSDAAILMAAIERWGAEEALDRISGDFAFALWDAGRRRLLLARDWIGQRPIHYRAGNRFFAFTSMAKGLQALPDGPRGADEEAMAEFLALLPETGTRSFFEGIEKVRPGHLVEVSEGGIERRRWWRPRPVRLGLRSAAEAAEALREKLDRAVEARLRGAGPAAGSHLSGGLDSSAVTATAARRLAPGGGRLLAFTAVPRPGYAGGALADGIADEGPLAAATAALHPNVEHVLVAAGGRSPLDHLGRDFAVYERPILNVSNAAWTQAINDEARARGLTVLLTGSTGNMTISYNGLAVLPDLLGRGRWLRLLRLAAQLHRGGSRWGSLAAQTLGPFLPAPLWETVRRLRGRHSGLEEATMLRADVARRLDLDARARARGIDLALRPPRDALAARLAVFHAADRGNYNKGTLGGWGIDVRDPTADRELIEFCLAVPAEHWLAGGRARGLARLAFTDRLPAAVTGEMRKGHQAADWHEGLNAARAEIAAEVERIAACPQAAALLDVERMRALVHDWPDGGWTGMKAHMRYRQALLRGIAAGHFVRKAAQPVG